MLGWRAAKAGDALLLLLPLLLMLSPSHWIYLPRAFDLPTTHALQASAAAGPPVVEEGGRAHPHAGGRRAPEHHQRVSEGGVRGSEDMVE